MTSGNLSPQRREVIVRSLGDGNCFYRAIAPCRDEMSDEKHEELRRLNSCLTEINQRFLSRYYFLRTLGRNMSRTARSWEL